ncbi:MAG: tRNA pseudouridine synthase A [Lachnospiraceae bacterium]|nr:tRNA pseudouridine synthase A [Lachnospiraceae bacterium]
MDVDDSRAEYGNRRIRLTVAYDGTAYHGWQIQPGKATIEETLNVALSDLFEEPVKVLGLSRTDAGVHALGNIAVFDAGGRIPADKVCYALNARLPGDIRVRRSEEVPAGWHPRKVPCVKTYRYRICNARTENPLTGRYSYFFHEPLDIGRMRAGAAYLVGEHDFAAFCAAGAQNVGTVRRIDGIAVVGAGDIGDDIGTGDLGVEDPSRVGRVQTVRGHVTGETGTHSTGVFGADGAAAARPASESISITVWGNGFLYNMVRIIAGTLIAVGSGAKEPQWVGEVLASRDRRQAGPTAPAKGLTLVGVVFDRAQTGLP